MKPAHRTKHLENYYFAGKLEEIARLKQAGRPVINLGIGSPDMSPHPDVRIALAEAEKGSESYQYKPYKGLPLLRKAISTWHERTYAIQLDPENEILPLMGSKEGIGFISMAYLNPGDKVLVPDPGYPTYSSATRMAGAIPVAYNLTEENSWLPDFEELESLIDGKVKILWVNYPHMPTGQNASRELFGQLVDFAKRHEILLCIDNPYSLILNSTPISILEIPGSKEVVLELNSLSKSHNLAGARIGWIAGTESLLSNVFRISSNFGSGMFEPLQHAAIAALNLSSSWIEHLNGKYSQRRALAGKIFEELECRFQSESAGLFLWGRIPNSYSSGEELSDLLLHKADVFITPGSIFGNNGRQFLRISLCSPPELLEQALIRIEQFQRIFKKKTHEFAEE